LSTTYNTVAGDTFEKISRKVYGRETRASLLAASNPGITEPIGAGLFVSVPPDPVLTDTYNRGSASSPDEVAVRVGLERLRAWESVTITLSLDGLSEFSLSSPSFDAFTPFAFEPCDITIGGDLLFTGTVVSVDPVVEPSRQYVDVSGYATPGVLADCTASRTSYPVQFDGLTLPQVAETLCAPFSVPVQFDGLDEDVVEKAAIGQEQTVFNFLGALARQFGYVLTNTPDGALRIKKSATVGVPVAVLVQGASPVVSVAAQFGPRQYFSHVTAFEPAKIAALGGDSYTTSNKFMRGQFRPFTFIANDAPEGGARNAADAKTGRMFANAAQYSVVVSTWRDPRGALWAPDTFITLTAPGAFIKTAYTFLVRAVTFNASADERTAALVLVLPGAFSGQIPENLPWLG
jgi:prophage tail gpP-like protein/phage tail protein X